MKYMKYIGWISTILLISCSIPEIVGGIQGKSTASYGLIGLWLGGEVFGFIYALYLRKLPLIANYGINTLLVSILLMVKMGIL